MLKWPNDALKDGVEICLIKGVQFLEVELYQGFYEGEEVCADLWEWVEVCCY